MFKRRLLLKSEESGEASQSAAVSVPAGSLAITGYAPTVEGLVWTPADLTGLQLWLDATDLSYLFQDAGKTTPVTSDGDVVGCWADAVVPERTAFERVKKWIRNLFKGSKDV